MPLIILQTLLDHCFCSAEYAFGGHSYNWSGIFDMTPKAVDTLGEDFKFSFVKTHHNQSTLLVFLSS